jgi:hypothetical protein
VGFESEMKAVFTPPIRVVLPAKPFTITVKTKAMILANLIKAELFVVILPLSRFHLLLFPYKIFSVKN